MVIRVSPNTKSPTHQISLSDGREIWGLRLIDGPEGLTEIPMTPSTIHFSGLASKFGDWDPAMSHLEQRTWVGGRANASFDQDSSRFFDSQMAFSMIDSKIFPAPQWKFVDKIRETYQHMPGDMAWQALLADKMYISAEFTIGGSNFDAQKVYIWLRRIGTPGTVTIQIWVDSGGSPDTLLASATGTLSKNTVTDVISRWISVDVSAASDLAANTKYHIVVIGASTDNTGNHWEVGKDISGTGSQFSTAGSSWTAAQFTIYHRVVDTATDRRFYKFEFRGAVYAVDRKADGTASQLYINGDRGKATSATATVLTDSNKSWTVDEWIGAWVRINGGTGANQPAREITDNGTDSLTTAAWDITPDNTSLYVIYSTDKMTDISPGAGDEFDIPVTGEPLVAEEVVYFPRGNAVNIYKMQWDDTANPPVHNFRDDTGDNADVLHGFSDATNEFQIYVAENVTMTAKRFSTVAYAANLAAGTAIDVGDDSAQIIRIFDYNDKVWAFKADGIYDLSGDKAQRKGTGLDFMPSDNLGEAAANRNFFLFLSWGGFDLIQLQENAAMVDMANIGPSRGEGLPSDRKGKISAVAFHPSGLFVAIDAGDSNYSSVLVRTDPVGYHEIFRAPETGMRIRGMYWQTCPGTFPRLWIDVGDDMIFQEWPRDTFNPLQDNGVNYQHECVIISSTYDMGVARLHKYISQIALISKNFQTGIEARIEYQVDTDIGTNIWLSAGTFYLSPESEVDIDIGKVKQFRFRIRLLTDDADIPPIIRATVMEGFARTPVKYQYKLLIQASHTQRTLSGSSTDHNPDLFFDWLKEVAGSAGKVYMNSIWESANGINVIVEPSALQRDFSNSIAGVWGGNFQLMVRER